MEKPLQNREGVGVGNEFSCCQNCCPMAPQWQDPTGSREERNVGDTICKELLPQTQSMADKGREQFLGVFGGHDGSGMLKIKKTPYLRLCS